MNTGIHTRYRATQCEPFSWRGTIALLASLVLGTNAASAGVEYIYDFESGSFPLNCQGDCPTVTTEISRSGKYGMKSVTPAGGGKKRTEAVTKGNAKFMEFDRQLIDKLKNYTEFWNITSRLMLLLNQKGKVRDTQEMENFKTIIDNTLLNNEENALSYETRYLYFQIYSAYYFGTGDYKKSYDFIRKHLELIEDHSEVFKEEPNKYFSALSNIIYLCTQLQKYNEIPRYLGKLKSISTSNIKMNEDLAIKLFSSTYSAELALYMQTGEFEKAIVLVDVINEGLKKYEGKISKIRESYFRFTIAQVYFATGDFSQAIKWINQLLNDQDIDDSQDIHCMARIFNLIIHLEAGNDELVSYTIRSTQRYLDKRNRIYKFESVFLLFVNKLLKSTDANERKESFKALRKELVVISKDPFEKSAFEYFDFVSWVEGKYLAVPFREMVKNKMKQKSLKAIEG